MKKVIVKTLGLYLNTLSIVSPDKAGKKGFELFCRPLRAPINDKQKEFFNTADKINIQHRDLNIRAYKWGRGEKKVLFLHGWQSHTYRWKPYIDALSKDEYTIYSLDAPGHGLSDGNFLSVPVYSDLIQNFIIEVGNIDAIIGHSLGGFSLLHTFHAFPLLNVKKVILMAPPGEATDFFTFYQQTLGLTDRTLKIIFNYFERQYNVSPSYFSSAVFAESLHIPTLIIHDAEDMEAPYHYSKRLESVAKNAMLITTKGLGHNLRSPEVVRAVTDFIENDYVKKPKEFTSMTL